MPTIGKKLQRLREARKLTKTEMAKQLGAKSYSTIIKWEIGENHPKGRELKELCEFFNVSADYLLGIDKRHTDEAIDYYKYYPSHVSGELLESIQSNEEIEEELKWLEMRHDIMGKYAGNNDVFFVNISNNAMDKVIPNGSKIAIKPVNNFESLKNDDIVLFSKDNEFSIKRFYNDTKLNRMIFRPESTDNSHIDIVIPYDHLEDAKIYGKVVVTISQFN